MGPALTLVDFEFRYFEESSPALSGLNLSVPAHSCCAVLGPTGAGKTTLLSVLSGASGSQFKTAAADGTVIIGETVHKPLPRKILFPDIGYVQQDAAIQISGIRKTVRGEIDFTLDNLGIPRRDRPSRIQETLERLDLLQLAERNPADLSGGETQRVALASVLVANPPVLLLDEPASPLDGLSFEQLKALLRSFKATRTIIFTDVTIDFALSLADSIVVLDKGRNVFTGTPSAFFESLETFDKLLPVESWKKLRASPEWQSIRTNLL